MIKSAVVSVTFRKKNVEEIVYLCKKAEIKAIEWGSDVHLPSGDIKKAAEIKKLCTQNNIEIAGYATYYYIGDYDNYKTEFQRYLDVACALGAPIMRIWAGSKGSADVTPEIRQQWYCEANAIANMAHDCGVQLSFEYHAKTLTDSLSSTEMLLTQAPLAKTHWQIPNAQQLAQSIIDVQTLEPKISTIHVHNCTDRVYGDLESKKDYFATVFQLLQGDHFACIEFVNGGTEEQFLKDAQTLNTLCETTAERTLHEKI